MTRHALLFLIVLSALALGLAACGGGNEAATTGGGAPRRRRRRRRRNSAARGGSKRRAQVRQDLPRGHRRKRDDRLHERLLAPPRRQAGGPGVDGEGTDKITGSSTSVTLDLQPGSTPSTARSTDTAQRAWRASSSSTSGFELARPPPPRAPPGHRVLPAARRRAGAGGLRAHRAVSARSRTASRPTGWRSRTCAISCSRISTSTMRARPAPSCAENPRPAGLCERDRRAAPRRSEPARAKRPAAVRGRLRPSLGRARAGSGRGGRDHRRPGSRPRGVADAGHASHHLSFLGSDGSCYAGDAAGVRIEPSSFIAPGGPAAGHRPGSVGTVAGRDRSQTPCPALPPAFRRRRGPAGAPSSDARTSSHLGRACAGRRQRGGVRPRRGGRARGRAAPEWGLLHAGRAALAVLRGAEAVLGKTRDADAEA